MCVCVGGGAGRAWGGEAGSIHSAQERGRRYSVFSGSISPSTHPHLEPPDPVGRGKHIINSVTW